VKRQSLVRVFAPSGLTLPPLSNRSPTMTRPDTPTSAQGRRAADQAGSKRRSRLPAAARRDHLLDTARALVVSEGTEGVTMEAVAAAAGVSKTLGYAYFENRIELLLALFDREVGRLYQRTAAEMEEPLGLEGKFRAGVRVWFDVAGSEDAGVASVLLQSNKFRGKLGQRRDSTIRQLEGLYGHLVAKEYGIPEDKAVVVVAALLAGLAGVVDRWRSTGEPRHVVEGTFLEMVAVSLRGLAPP
jgi:AcrR family transcriptional regulator